MDMKGMMRQAQKMQKQLAKVQDEVKGMENTASAGGGMVSATVTGETLVKSIKIDPEAIDPDDVEMLEDLVTAAVNEALRGMNDISNAKIGEVTGGMNIPGL